MTAPGILRSLAIVAVAAVALAAMRFTTPGYATLTGPLEQSAKLGERAEGRAFGAKVGAPRFAKRVRAKMIAKSVVRDTEGVWVVVPAELWATSETATVMGAVWAGPSGRSFSADPRVDQAKALVIGKPLQPGLSRRGLIVFEIPADEAAGARLKLSLTSDPRLDTQLSIAVTGEGPQRIEDELDLDDGDLHG